MIDDFGETSPKRNPNENWLRIQWPITFAVIPGGPLSERVAEAAVRSGKDVIIHFPFDPYLHLQLPTRSGPNKSDLRQVRTFLEASMDQLPWAIGLNNHQSYRSTMNRPLMRWFMQELKSRGLYFIDSRVSERSVAFREAVRAGLPALRNDIFLDRVGRGDYAFCREKLFDASRLARQRGYAVVIGHHYFSGTYRCLTDTIPLIQADGVEFVYSSELVDVPRLEISQPIAESVSVEHTDRRPSALRSVLINASGSPRVSNRAAREIQSMGLNVGRILRFKTLPSSGVYFRGPFRETAAQVVSHLPGLYEFEEIAWPSAFDLVIVAGEDAKSYFPEKSPKGRSL